MPSLAGGGRRRRFLEKGARNGFFRTVEERLGALEVVAEDLGYLTPEVHALLRRDQGYPGMKVLQFAFDGSADNAYLPHNHVPGCVVYVGMHDNNTVLGWLEEAGEESVQAGNGIWR